MGWRLFSRVFRRLAKAASTRRSKPSSEPASARARGTGCARAPSRPSAEEEGSGAKRRGMSMSAQRPMSTERMPYSLSRGPRTRRATSSWSMTWASRTWPRSARIRRSSGLECSTAGCRRPASRGTRLARSARRASADDLQVLGHASRRLCASFGRLRRPPLAAARGQGHGQGALAGADLEEHVVSAGATVRSRRSTEGARRKFCPRRRPMPPSLHRGGSPRERGRFDRGRWPC